MQNVAAPPAMTSENNPKTAGMTTKVVKGSLWTLAGQIAPLAFSMAATPFTIRLLGAEGYGVLVLTALIPTYLGFADMGMSIASTKFASEAFAADDPEQEARIVRTAALIAFLSSLPFAVLIFVFSARLASLFNVPEHLFGEASLALKFASITFVINFLNAVFNTPQLTRLRMDLNTFVTSGFRILGIVATPLIIYLGGGISGAVFALMIASMLTLAAHLFTSRRLLPPLLRASVSTRAVRPLLYFGGAYAVSTIAALLLGNSEKFILAHSTTIKELAYYSVAYTIATMLTMFSGSMTQSLIPAFSQLQAEEERGRLSDLYARCIRLTAIGFLPGVVFVAIIAKPFLTWWAGAEFGEESVGPLHILLAGLLLNAVAFFPAAIVVAGGRTDTLAKLYWVELALYIPLTFWLVSSYGALGAAAAWSIRVIADAVMLFLLARKVSGVSVGGLPNAAFPAFAVLAVPAAIVWYYGGLGPLVVIVSAVAFLGYGFIVWTRLLTNEERLWLQARINDRIIRQN